MSISTLNQPSIGRPITKFGVSLFPVYQWGQPVIGQAVIRPNDLVHIREMESPTVPTLIVENLNTVSVVIFAGETLEGGRQQRVLNQTVVLAPSSITEIPVSCVEQGRWHGSQVFGGVGRMSPNAVRRSAVRGAQHEVWNEVQHLLQARAVDSDTMALADFYVDPTTTRNNGSSDEGEYEKRRRKIDEVAGWGPLVGQTGIVVAQNGVVQSVDLFGSAEFLSVMWPKMIDSALSAPSLVANRLRHRDASDSVLKFLGRLAKTMTATSPSRSTGLGEHRNLNHRALSGQSLTLDGALVHVSAFPNVATSL